jgi:hypothetical protein
MIRKTIVILANSIKHHQHCVAGKCIATGQWIRPVSSPAGAELTHDQSTYSNPHGNFIVKPKQKIEMVLSSAVPLINQPENYLISEQRWEQRYRINDQELLSYLDYPETLWGEHDHVNYADIVQNRITIHQSLYLVQVEGLTLYKNTFGKRRAEFIYNGISYDFAVTDPSFDQKTSDDSDISGILCVSLGEEYQGSCYKLVATIF